MLDMLPRVHLLRQSQFRDVDHYVVYGRSLKFQAQTLERLGIHKSQIITSESVPHIRACQVVVPSTIRKYRVWATPRWACEFLRDSLTPEGNGGRDDWPERIYVSRRGASCRRITNEDAIEKLLCQRGFCTVVPGNLDLDLQIQVMRHAKVVVAPHGAALTNLVFCQPGTKVLEIFPPDSLPGFFWAISHHMNLDYYYVTGIPFDPDHFDEHQIGSLNPNHDDIFIPPDVLTGLLDLAGVD
jgi:capsular polysaccharide biosynthesis protein